MADLKEYISTGHYFTDAKRWYVYKYLSPVSHKIWAFYAVLVLIVVITTLAMNIRRLLPIEQTITYAISAEDQDIAKENARIINMDDSQLDITPHHFVASNLLSNYIIHRESYDYNKLTQQFLHIRNSSDRIVFKRFYDYMSIDNPDSPVIRYQKYAKRTIKINDIKFASNTDATLMFTSTATDENGKVFENLSWVAHIGFEMDDIKNKLTSGSKFSFMVKDYKLKILEEKE
jgi:type IV secretion system protein VirB8